MNPGKPWEAEGGAFQVGGVATGMPRTHRSEVLERPRGLRDTQSEAPGRPRRTRSGRTGWVPFSAQAATLQEPEAGMLRVTCTHTHVRTLAGNRRQRGRRRDAEGRRRTGRRAATTGPLRPTASPPSATCSTAGSARPAGSPVAGDPGGSGRHQRRGKEESRKVRRS